MIAFNIKAKIVGNAKKIKLQKLKRDSENYMNNLLNMSPLSVVESF